MSLFAPAVKEKLKARVAIDGPTGSGKTWTALQLATILAPDGPIGVIDTENRSAAYYAPSPGQLAGTEPMERMNPWDPPYVFGHLPQQPPYSPVDLATMIKAAAAELGTNGVLVIDSLTHFWNGEGGTLDIVDNAALKTGNSYMAWKEGTPAQRHLLDTIIHADCHVVVTMRSKMDYVQEEYTDKKGNRKTMPRKIGMAPEQRAGVEYEFTVVADMDLEHRLVVSKSRCSLIADAVQQIGRSAEIWQKFAAWLDSGVERMSVGQVDAISAMFAKIPDGQARQTVEAEFAATFGTTPAELTTDRFDEAKVWAEAAVAAFLTPDPAIVKLWERVKAARDTPLAAVLKGTAETHNVPLTQANLAHDALLRASIEYAIKAFDAPPISSSPVQPGRTYPTNPDPVYGEQDQGEAQQDGLPYEPVHG